jgi:hypothetical protein
VWAGLRYGFGQAKNAMRMAKRNCTPLRTARFTNRRKNGKHPTPPQSGGIPRVQPDVWGLELQNSFGVSLHIVGSGGEQRPEQC